MECVWKCTIIRFLLIIFPFVPNCRRRRIKQHLTLHSNDIPYVQLLSHNNWHTVYFLHMHGMSSFNYYHFRFLKWPHSNASQFFIQICIFLHNFFFLSLWCKCCWRKKWYMTKKAKQFFMFFYQQMDVKKFPIH